MIVAVTAGVVRLAGTPQKSASLRTHASERRYREQGRGVRLLRPHRTIHVRSLTWLCDFAIQGERPTPFSSLSLLRKTHAAAAESHSSADIAAIGQRRRAAAATIPAEPGAHFLQLHAQLSRSGAFAAITATIRTPATTTSCRDSSPNWSRRCTRASKGWVDCCPAATRGVRSNSPAWII